MLLFFEILMIIKQKGINIVPMHFDFSVKYNQNSQWVMDRNHFHEGFEILLSLTDAEGSFFIEDHLYPLKKGSLLLINDAVLHHSVVNNDAIYSRFVLHFSKDTLEAVSSPQTNFLDKLEHLPQYCLLNEEKLNLLTAMFIACEPHEVNKFGYDIKRKMAFINILLFVIEELDDPDKLQPAMPTNFVKVMPILRFIQTHITKELSLDEIADQFFISKYHLCHMFKEATGFTVNNYIINYRILKARELLRKGESVQATAEQTGFKSYSHFIRTFTKLTQVSPGQYMRSYRDVIT